MEEARTKIPETKEFGTRMKGIMKVYNTKKNKDILSQVKHRVDTANINVIQKIEKEREYLEDLKHTKENLEETLDELKEFKRNTEDLEREAFWMNKKYQILIWGGLLLLLILVGIFVCKLVL